MIKVAGTIAFLCGSMREGLDYLRANEKIMQMDGTTKAMIQRGNKFYQALIVSNEEQLRAVELKEYVIVDPVSKDLELMAKSRCRP